MPLNQEQRNKDVSPLLRYCPQRILDTFHGFAGLLDPEFRLKAVSRSWDDAVYRSGRNELTSTTVLGSHVLDHIQDDEQRKFFRKILSSMARRELDTFSQVVDFSQGGTKLFAQVIIHPIWDEGIFVGYLAQAQDITRYHQSELVLLEREQRLRTVTAENKQRSEKLLFVLWLEQFLLSSTDPAETAQKFLEKLCEQLHGEKAWLELSIPDLQPIEALWQLKSTSIPILRAKVESNEPPSNAKVEQFSWDGDGLEGSKQSFVVRTAFPLAQGKGQIVVMCHRERLPGPTDLKFVDIACHRYADSLSLRKLSANKGEQEKRPKLLASDQTWLSNAAQNLEDFDRALCQFFVERTGSLFSVFYIAEDDGSKLVMAAQFNATEYHQVAANSKSCDFLPGEGPPGITFQKGVATKFDHLATNEAYAPWLAIALESGYNCLWSFPLKDEIGVSGVVQVFYAEENYDLTIDQLSSLQGFSELCAPYVRLAHQAKQNCSRERQLLELLDQHPEPLCWFGKDGKIVLASKSFAQLVGMSTTELPGSFVNELLKESSRNGYTACLGRKQEFVELELKSDSEAESGKLLVYPLYSAGDILSGFLAEEKKVIKPEPVPVVEVAEEKTAPAPSLVDDGFRVITGELADQFGNLLTGVLGHASLVAAELNHEDSTSEDVSAISRAARTAAKIARQMTVLCGAARHAGAQIDVGRWLRSYVEKERTDFFAQGKAGLELTHDRCPVTGDVATLEIILDGMAEHCQNGLRSESAPTWKLQVLETSAKLSLCYEGEAMIPQGWPGELIQVHSHGKHQAILLAREAARAVGGTMDFEGTEEKVELVLTLPLIGSELHA